MTFSSGPAAGQLALTVDDLVAAAGDGEGLEPTAWWIPLALAPSSLLLQIGDRSRVSGHIEIPCLPQTETRSVWNLPQKPRLRLRLEMFR